MTQESQPKPEDELAVEDEAVVEESTEDTPVEPLTSEYIKDSVVGLSDDARNAFVGLYEDAKDVWVNPINKGIRSRFNKARRFFSELGGE